jgi:hypothetical protein
VTGIVSRTLEVPFLLFFKESMMLSNSHRPTLLTLPDRVQPGSVIGQGLDWSALAGPILSDGLVSPVLEANLASSHPVASRDASGNQAAVPGNPGMMATARSQPLRGLENICNLEPLNNPLIPLLSASPAPGATGSGRHGAPDGRPPEAVPANTLFYGGDFDGIDDLSNENNSTVSDARTYGNFYVTDPSGWDITTVFSNNELSFFPSGGVNWEIRSGLSENNGGTLVASGTGYPGTFTVVGEAFGDLEVQVAVDLSASPVHLDPGQYWLNVTPVGHGTGRSFVAETQQVNAIGTQDTGNCYQDSTYFGTSFELTTNIISTAANFSLGVGGSVTGSVSPHGSHSSHVNAA